MGVLEPGESVARAHPLAKRRREGWGTRVEESCRKGGAGALLVFYFYDYGPTLTVIPPLGIPFATTSKFPTKPCGTLGQSNFVETSRSPVATPMLE